MNFLVVLATFIINIGVSIKNFITNDSKLNAQLNDWRALNDNIHLVCMLIVFSIPWVWIATIIFSYITAEMEPDVGLLGLTLTGILSLGVSAVPTILAIIGMGHTIHGIALNILNKDDDDAADFTEFLLCYIFIRIIIIAVLYHIIF